MIEINIKILQNNLNKFIFEYLNTARKNIFPFSKCSEKMVFPESLDWNVIFLELSRKMIFLFLKILIIFFRRKRKITFLKEIHGIMTFSESVLKRWLFHKNCTARWSFLHYHQKFSIFFSQKYDLIL